MNTFLLVLPIALLFGAAVYFLLKWLEKQPPKEISEEPNKASKPKKPVGRYDHLNNPIARQRAILEEDKKSLVNEKRRGSKSPKKKRR